MYIIKNKNIRSLSKLLSKGAGHGVAPTGLGYQNTILLFSITVI